MFGSNIATRNPLFDVGHVRTRWKCMHRNIQNYSLEKHLVGLFFT